MEIPFKTEKSNFWEEKVFGQVLKQLFQCHILKNKNKKKNNNKICEVPILLQEN